MERAQKQLDQMFVDKGFRLQRLYYQGVAYSVYNLTTNAGDVVDLYGYMGKLFDNAQEIKKRIDWLDYDEEDYEDELDMELYRMEMDGEYI